MIKGIDDNNFYALRCQLYNHRGGGFVIEIVEKENEFLLYHQTDGHNPRRERFKIGRIDSVITASWWMDCPPQRSQLQELWQSIVNLTAPSRPFAL